MRNTLTKYMEIGERHLMVTLPKLGRSKVYQSIFESTVQDRSSQLVDLPKSGKRVFTYHPFLAMTRRQTGFSSPKGANSSDSSA